MSGRALLALLSALVVAAPVSAKPAAKPAAHAVDWTRTVAGTTAGGYVMGNPKAKVRLIEYGSLSCPHCRRFDSEGAAPLIGKYVRSGKVSWEFRNYIRDPVDMAAALIARCNGSKSFFALSRALFNDQPAWFGKAVATPQDQLQELIALPPEQRFAAMARISGLDTWATAHGLPAARTRQCLTNSKSIDQLTKMTGQAVQDHPDFQGTPTFVINGQMVKDVGTWDALEPQLKAAVGG